MNRFRSKLRMLWNYLREVTGEYDYVRYRSRAVGTGEEPLSPQEFYLQQLERKYSRISQCC